LNYERQIKIPVLSQSFQLVDKERVALYVGNEISEFNKIIHSNNNIKAKDLIVGGIYKTKDNEEYVYMGRFDYWKTEYEYPEINGRINYNNYVIKDINKGKYHYFVKESKDWDGEPHLETLKLKSLGNKIISMVSQDCIENYAELFDKLECKTCYSPYDKSKDIYELRTLEDFEAQVKDMKHWERFYGNKDGIYEILEIKKYRNLKDEELNNRNDFYVRVKGQDDYEFFWPSKISSDNNRRFRFIEPLFSGTIEEIYNQFKPSLRCKYLKNNKLHGKEQN
jgi:hypothetical protein